MCTKKVLAICAFLLCLLSARAQENFRDGYVVTLQGDTLKGQIDYRDWEVNPTKISFKNISGQKLEYPPESVRAFYVANEHYESAFVPFNEAVYEINKVSPSEKITFGSGQFFLQRLVDGPVSLFALEFKTDKEQFYAKKDGKFDLLVYHKFSADVPNGDFFKINTRYLNQLNLYCGDCKNTTSNLKGLKYTRLDLINFFKKYNDCIGFAQKYVNQPKRVKGVTGVLLGYSNIAGGDLLSASHSVTAGLYLNLTSGRRQRKFSSYNELLFYQYKSTGTESDYHNENYYDITTYDIKQIYLRLNSMIRFQTSIGQGKIFVNAGISGAFLVSDNSKIVTEEKFYATHEYSERTGEGFGASGGFGFIMGIGGSIKRFSLDVRALPDSDATQWQILCGYRLRK